MSSFLETPSSEPCTTEAAAIGEVLKRRGYEVRFVFGGVPVVKKPDTLEGTAELLKFLQKIGVSVTVIGDCAVIGPGRG